MKQIKTYINEKLRLTTKRQYTCQPKNWNELRQIILQRIEDEGYECDLNDIDVSKITFMGSLFDAFVCGNVFKNFDGDVSQWNVSNVTNMAHMFSGCKKFNCDISRWDVSNVENMDLMFYGCEKFNQNLNSWDVSNVDAKNMTLAFYNCPTTPTWYDKDTLE